MSVGLGSLSSTGFVKKTSIFETSITKTSSSSDLRKNWDAFWKPKGSQESSGISQRNKRVNVSYQGSCFLSFKFDMTCGQKCEAESRCFPTAYKYVKFFKKMAVSQKCGPCSWWKTSLILAWINSRNWTQTQGD